ncbi:MAG: hypothetical protein WCV84_02370 [Patescibacteria group bacterium]
MKRLLYTTILTSLALPVTVFAATPQQLLDKAIVTTKTANTVHLNGTLNYTERVYTSKTLIKDESYSFIGSFRSPLSAQKTSEGRLEVKRLKPNLDALGAIQWKVLEKESFGRVEYVGEDAYAWLIKSDPELAKWIGWWIRFDTTTSSASTLFNPERFTAGTPAEPLLSALEAKTYKKLPVLRATGISRARDASGKMIWRVSARLNPTFLSAEHQKTLKAIRTRPDYSYYSRAENNRLRAESIKRAQQDYQRTLKYWNMPRFVAVIDPLTNRLQRVEVGIVYTQPTQTCPAWDPLKQRFPACRTTGIKTFRFNGGISLLEDGGPLIERPSIFIDFEELNKILNAKPLPASSQTSTESVIPLTP